MRFSKNFSFNKEFFHRRNILSENQAFFFIAEELALLALMIAQGYQLLGVSFAKNSVLFFQTPISTQNLLWFLATLIFFLIGYIVIVLRDDKVNSIHKNFSKVFFFEIKERVFFTRREVTLFVFAELMFAIILAVSIYLYLDPEINIVPYPYNYVGFGIFIVVSYLFFSHTKEFRQNVYGPTPVQKRIHEGKQELIRTTHSKSGTIRIGAKKARSKRS
ncbi:MAG: hypothetical protein WCW13_03670 [archaeon]|jgi:hypothetical protein